MIPGLPIPRGRARRQPGVMNKLEALWAADLEIRRAAGEVLWFGYEAVTLKLANDCRLTPDFGVLYKDCEFGFEEVKGLRREDAMIKLKVAVDKFPFRFRLVERVNKQWVVTEIA